MLTFLIQSAAAALEMAPDTSAETDSTSELIMLLIAVTALAGVGTWLIFLWAIKDRQFDGVEDVAKRVLELDKQECSQG